MTNGKVFGSEDFPLAVGNWGDPIERERRRRITLSVLTYAYEVKDNPLVSDFTWDWLAQRVQPQMGTHHPLLDEFFSGTFTPVTGMWVHQHPELDKVAEQYERYIRHVNPNTWRMKCVRLA